jgi:2-polyprenyl-3-methyl-5-hydroxy-6-metoxy-1,4-benzoquinol methylase
MDIVERLTLEAVQEDTMIASEHRQRYEFAARLVPGAARVLDLCCGSGYGSEMLAAAAGQVTGVDRDAATIERARVSVGARVPNVSFEIAEAVEFLERDVAGRFDVAVCFEGLEHLSDLDRALVRLRDHASRGMRLIASVPNDRLSGVRNPFHVTMFGYDEAREAFAGFPSVVILPQFLAEGAVINPAGAAGAEDPQVELSLLDRGEPEYANHFLICAGFDAETVRRTHAGRLLLSASPIFNRWSEGLKQGILDLRRENARLGRARLGKAGSAAATALAAVQDREQRIAGLEHQIRELERAAIELEARLAAGEPPRSAPPACSRTIETRPGHLVRVQGEPDPNSWEHRRRRAAEVLLPWVEASAPLAGRIVLEYGCGNAAVSCAVAERAERVIGLDIDEASVREGREHVRERGLGNVELAHHPVEGILEAASALRGRVDVFLLYAVLEHLTVSERLAILRLAREVLPPDGAIVVCETPNRLTWFDHHTAQMPFLHLLPEELALEYFPRSARAQFTSAIAEALARGRPEAERTLIRWGRGVSFHELEVVFGELSSHVLSSSWEPGLSGERPVYSEELALARFLDRWRPDLDASWSRRWLDVVLSPEPLARRPALLRPWTAETVQSRDVGLTAQDTLRFSGPGAMLGFELPHPTDRLVIDVLSRDWRAMTLWLRAAGGETIALSHSAPQGERAQAQVRLQRPGASFTLEASDACEVGWIAYDA